MRDDGPPPSSHDPPELELAKHVIEYTCLVRHDPGRFARDYRETRERFWALLQERLDLRFFGSDFFDDLLAVAAHSEVARDVPSGAEPVLRRAGQLRALRRFQGGDVAGGLVALAEQLGRDAAGHLAASNLDPTPAGDGVPESVLTPALLEQLAGQLQEREPALAHAVRELVPLLSEDPTYTLGPRLDIVFCCSAVDGRHHPGYGVVAVLGLEAEALDRNDHTALRIGGVRLPVNAPFAGGIRSAVRGASVASRATRGSDLMRGVDLAFDIGGIPGHPTGESASLGFALLALWVGGCTWSRRQREPPRGSAAIGIVHADGTVHEVFEGALRAKLQRLRESGVRRLYVGESQRATCDALLRDGAPDGRPSPTYRREVEVIGVDRLDHLPAVEAAPQPVVRWLRRRARRHRLPILLGATALLLTVVLAMVFGVRIELQEARRDGNVLTGIYRWGRPRTVQLGSSFLLAPLAASSPALVDLDGDRALEVLVVSMEASGPNARQGRVRVDVLEDDLEVRWTRFVDPKLAFADGREFLATDLTPEIVHLDDWNGDGLEEIFVTANGLYFPSCTSVWDAAGRLRGQFINPGHVKALTLVPGTGSQRDLVLFGECAETRGCMVARLPAEFGIGAFPNESDRFRLVDHPAAPDGALFLEISPALPRLFDPRAQIWPGSLEWLGPEDPHVQISTLEFAPSGSLLRRLDVRLHQVDVIPTTAFLNDWRHQGRDASSPALDGDDVTRALESVRRWEAGVWHDERLPAWNPGSQ
jgi:hypothetical protein